MHLKTLETMSSKNGCRKRFLKYKYTSPDASGARGKKSEANVKYNKFLGIRRFFIWVRILKP